MIDDAKILEAAEASEEIAESLSRLADAAEKLMESGLTERAICILLKGKTGMRLDDIHTVLRALQGLRSYLSEVK